jgi:thiosulfate dehydrogenase
MTTRSLSKLTVAAFAIAALGASVVAQQKDLEVNSCDGATTVKIEGVRPGVRLPPDQAQALADTLMASWLTRQPENVAVAWRSELAAARADSSSGASLAQSSSRSAQTLQPVEFNARDTAMWERELAREIAYGNEVFHDDKLIGSPEGVSCAMCHPNASNTHPETYPKFQAQLKRVALLRDMVNWCIENPVRGKKLAVDDPKMRALEAYIMSQRKGIPMEFGKH